MSVSINWHLYSGCISVYCLYCSIILLQASTSEAIFKVPSEFKIESEVEITDPNRANVRFLIEEFVDTIEASVHLRVSRLKNHEIKDTFKYYRIRDAEPKDTDDWMISYHDADNLCVYTTLRDWPLVDLSHAIEILKDVDDAHGSGSFRKDRTLIGPGTLLRFISQEPEFFSHQNKVYDDELMAEMHLFEANLVASKEETMKIVLSMPAYGLIDDTKNQDDGMNLRSFELPPAKIIVFIVDSMSQKADLSALELIELEPSDCLYIKISYNSLEERSASRQLGLKAGGSASELNPFSLPPAAGCGTVGSHFLYIEATQFSGIFRAKDIADSQRYIAYDETTNHLRIDSIDNHKLVFDLKTRLITFVDLKYNGTGSACAQSLLNSRDLDSLFARVSHINDIIGFGSFRGLVYLGREILEDGTQCSVFEMKISYNQVPLILAMNLRIEIGKAHMLSVAFYFVDELHVEPTAGRLYNYQGYWLKRMELVSRRSMSKYRILNSQITFSEFSWSLDSMGEDESDREAKMRHPVRTFDILECRSEADQRQMDVLVVARGVSDLGSEPSTALQLSAEQLESVEEAAMDLIVRQTNLVRSQVNELELVLPPDGKSDWTSLQLSATITEPLMVSITKELVGWVYNVDEIPFGQKGKIISPKRMTRLECSMRLAAQLPADMTSYAMIYCQNLGCGYMKDLDSLVYTKIESFKSDADWPEISDNYYLCEVMSQTRNIDASIYQVNRLPDLAIETALNGSFVNIATGSVGVAPLTDESPVFRGQVKRVTMSSGHNKLDSMGRLFREGYCFNSHSISQGKFAKATIMLVELTFGLHQSIVFCHKACLLQANCMSYSYDKKTRLCHLTNIPPLKLEATLSQVPLREDKSCSIYTRNPVHSYVQTMDMSLMSLNGLSSYKDMNFFVARGDLDVCSGLCHMDELNCRRFHWFPLENLCYLEDRSSVIFETFMSPQQVEDFKSHDDRRKLFAAIVGTNLWSSFLKGFSYRQHFDHIFQRQANNRVRQLDKEYVEKLDLGDGNRSVFKLVAGDPIYDIDIDDCLSECAIIHANCVMADHYLDIINGYHTRVCSIHLLEQISQSDRLMLTDDGIRDANLLVADTRSTHHRLVGDNLLLRMMLFASSKTLSDQQTFQLERQSQLTEDNRYGKRDGLMDVTNQESDNLWPSLLSILLMVIGINISLVATICLNAGHRTERSMSTINLSEQFEMRQGRGSFDTNSIND